MDSERGSTVRDHFLLGSEAPGRLAHPSFEQISSFSPLPLRWAERNQLAKKRTVDNS